MRLGICKPPVAAGQGSGNRRYDIVPGKPDELDPRLSHGIDARPASRCPSWDVRPFTTKVSQSSATWILTLEGECGS